jgi:thioredoxin reductase (NADPH)
MDSDATRFPIGISGQALTGRAYVQAQQFGAEMMIPTEVSRMDCSQNPLTPPRLSL